jgi:hypothetical protein
MWRARFQNGPAAPHANALEADAACAGLAFARAYSSSDEYEAEVIQARRDAGVYGSQRRQARVAFALAATAIAVVFLAV